MESIINLIKTTKCRIIAVAVALFFCVAAWSAVDGKQITQDASVETQAEIKRNFVQDFLYFFSYEGNLERAMEKRRIACNKLLPRFHEIEEAIQKAEAVGDETEVMVQKALFQNFNNKLNEDICNFDKDWKTLIAIYLFFSISLVVLYLYFVFSKPVWKKCFSKDFATVIGGFGCVLLVVGQISWAHLIFWIIMALWIVVICKNWKKLHQS